MCATSAHVPTKPSTNGNRKTHAQHKAIAAALARGESIKSALLAGGYSPNTAKQGRKRIPQVVVNELAEADKHLVELGRTMDAAHQEDLARGRLRLNVITGKDEAYNSAKLLGQDRRVNMFVADQVAGLIVLQQSEKMPAPPKVLELPDAPVNRPKRLKP